MRDFISRMIPKICVAVLLQALGSHLLLAERVACEVLADGTLGFQIQDAVKDADYRIRLNDYKSGKNVGEVIGFAAGPLASVLDASWKPGELQALLRYKLLNNGTEVPLKESPMRLPDEMAYVPADLDRGSSTIRWSTPMASVTHVVASLSSGMDIKEIVPWHFSGPVVQSTTWDFWDENRRWNYRESPMLGAYTQSFALPEGFLVLGRPMVRDYLDTPLFKDQPPLPVQAYKVFLKAMVENYTSTGADTEKLPIVGPGTAIRVELSPESRKVLFKTRYELIFYFDGEFIHEENEGTDPTTYLLPDIPAAEGLHAITVKVHNYNGTYGLETLRIHYSRNLKER